MLVNADELDKAWELLEAASASGGSSMPPHAQALRDTIGERQGLEQARVLLEAATALRNPRVASMALYWLGSLLARQGASEDAELAYRGAITWWTRIGLRQRSST